MYTYRNRIRKTKQKAYRKIQTNVNENCSVPNTGNEPNTIDRRTFQMEEDQAFRGTFGWV